MDDEHVGAENLAWGNLAVGVRPCASGVDDISLFLMLVTAFGELRGGGEVRDGTGQTWLVKVRHSLLGTPPISLKTRVLGPLTGPVGTMTTWAVDAAMVPRNARPMSFILGGDSVKRWINGTERTRDDGMQ